MQGCHNTQSTAKFCRIFNGVIDFLNVSRLNQEKKGKREFFFISAAYENVNEWLFKIKIEIRVSWEIFKSR